MQKRRILFITPLPPPVHGSAMVSQYIKENKELEKDFICDFVNLSTSRKMDEIGKKSLMKYLRFIGAYFQVLWKLITHRYVLCYLAITCHGIGFLKDAPFVLLCKLFRRKVVIHQHNKGMSKCVDRQPYKWLLPLVYKNTKVILLSWFLYPDIQRIIKKEQVIICPNGIPHTPYEEPRHKHNNQFPCMLFLSNLIPSKGVYVLLDACRILKEKGYTFVCNFIGGETKEITKQIFQDAVKERGLEHIVKYHGPKYGNEKIEFFINSDIFIFPTFYNNECFPLVLLEAMQYKLPVISTDEGAIPDIIHNGINGFVCKRNDATSTAEAIETLLNHKDRCKEMGANGYKLFEQELTLQKFNHNIHTILYRIATTEI